ncbi:hypothetical protein [Oscillibacter sp.]|uniref:hypothetical protein n=1 Tax=Oscillibacter sp. TaxID=1945593 RepID=UPI0028984FC6|nr:hypothetical protein [Oscillibacter sp.]
MTVCCVVVLDGRQPVSVLRLAASHFTLLPFFAFFCGIAVEIQNKSQSGRRRTTPPGCTMSEPEPLNNKRRFSFICPGGALRVTEK